jgi:hypothetical protein
MFDNRLRNAHEPEIHFGPVGQCIYCKAVAVPLSNEHIIPDGLGGNLILLKSSCKSCAKITGRIETKVLQMMFGSTRAALGMRSLKSIKAKRAQIDTLVVRLGDINSTDAHEVSIENEPPFFLAMFRTNGPPGILRPAGSPAPLFEPVWIVPTDIRKRSEKNFGENYSVVLHLDVNYNIMIQMIMKISHAYAVACLGLDGFNPLLSDHIIGDQKNIDFTFVGARDHSVPFYSLHDLKLIKKFGPDGKLYWICLVRVFSFLATPLIGVVVGTVK